MQIIGITVAFAASVGLVGSLYMKALNDTCPHRIIDPFSKEYIDHGPDRLTDTFCNWAENLKDYNLLYTPEQQSGSENTRPFYSPDD